MRYAPFNQIADKFLLRLSLTIQANYRGMSSFMVCNGNLAIPPKNFQFGFLPLRSTAMALSLVYNVSEFYNDQGPAMFLCSLDTKGIFN